MTATDFPPLNRSIGEKFQSQYDPVVHICSSSEVYGQVKKDEVPIKETNPFRPASPYAVSKVGELTLLVRM